MRPTGQGRVWGRPPSAAGARPAAAPPRALLGLRSLRCRPSPRRPRFPRPSPHRRPLPLRVRQSAGRWAGAHASGDAPPPPSPPATAPAAALGPSQVPAPSSPAAAPGRAERGARAAARARGTAPGPAPSRRPGDARRGWGPAGPWLMGTWRGTPVPHLRVGRATRGPGYIWRAGQQPRKLTRGSHAASRVAG